MTIKKKYLVALPTFPKEKGFKNWLGMKLRKFEEQGYTVLNRNL